MTLGISRAARRSSGNNIIHGGHQGAKKSTTEVLSVIRGKWAGVSSIRGDRIASLIKIAMSAASCLPVGERDFYFCVISCDQEVVLLIK